MIAGRFFERGIAASRAAVPGLALAARIVAAGMLFTGPVFAADPAPAPLDTIKASIVEITNLDQGTIKIRLEQPASLAGKDFDVTVAGGKEALSKALPGDVMTATVDSVTKPATVKQVATLGRSVPAIVRLAVLAAAFVALALITACVVQGSPTQFMIGADNRYSNSKSQMLLWFGAVATVYLAAVALRIIYLGWDYVGGVDLPQNLIVLTGLSAFTFGGAKVITAQKVTNAQLAGLPPVKTPAARPNLLSDLVQNDRGQADLGDFQMILVALAAVVIFGLTAFHFLGVLALEQHVTIPDIDTTLLAGFGIGHGAYLVKKAAVDAGQG